MRNVPGQPYCHSETLLFIPQTYTLSRQPSGSYPGSSDFSRISKSHYIPHDRIQPYSFVNLLLGKSLCFFPINLYPLPTTVSIYSSPIFFLISLITFVIAILQCSVVYCHSGEELLYSTNLIFNISVSFRPVSFSIKTGR